MLIHVLASFVLVFGFVLIHCKLGGIMATLQELNDKLDSVAAGVNGLEDAIKALKEQVANGGVVTQAELDGLMAKATAIGDDISDNSDQ